MAPSPTRSAHRPSAREDMLRAALDHLATSGTLSLDQAARAAGVTKPGLMYHFATKEALMVALVDHLLAEYRRQLSGVLEEVCGRVVTDPSEAPATDRLRAYVAWSCTTPLGSRDLVLFADPALRERLTRLWVAEVEPWVAIPEDAPAGERRAMLAMRFLADGVWFCRASGVADVSADDARELMRWAEVPADAPRGPHAGGAMTEVER